MEAALTFTQSQWDLVLGTLVATLFALIAGFVYSISTRSEVGARYRPAVTASSLVLVVASLSYIALTLSWIFGYKTQGTLHVPNPSFQYNNGLRYMDWTVSVPLLTLELVGVSVLVGTRAMRARVILVTSAVLMIVTGFLGEDVFGSRGHNDGALWLWGAISTVPFLVAYLYIFKICAESAKALPADVGQTFRNIAFVFAFTWGVYPLAYLVQIFWSDSANWGVARQLSFSLATIVAKVGYMMLVHKVAKMRTALDVTNAEQSHPEEVWMSSVKLSESRPPLGVYLLEHSNLLRDQEPASSGVYPESPERSAAGDGMSRRT